MGKHRKSRARAIARAALVPSAAVAVIAAATGTASAAPNELPSQGGVTSAPSQGGVTSAPSTQGGVTSSPAQPEPVYWVEPPAQYQNIEYQPLENYDYDTNTYTQPQNYYVAPIQVQDLHLPTHVDPTAPIIAPRNTLRLGDFLIAQPNWFTDGDLARTNNTSAIIEAEVATFWRSIGVETPRANRLAAAQIGGGATGAVGGAALVGVPAALAGGTVGGIVGAQIGTIIPLPFVIPGLPVVTSGVAGTAIGAAVAGIPAAAVGAVGGAGFGIITGTAFGAGDLGEPREITVPDIDEPAVTAQTQNTLAEWDSTPVGAVAASAIRDVVAAAPGIDQQARDFVAAQPGGEQVLNEVDAGLATFFTDSSLGVASSMISEAVGAGIQA
ncbi:hypothetical protein ERC79_15230 [Rhodococcus sp. ABRD24]|uniref:hypothetical protein n=1 Tax=Rhodococcus sp. ABRD24 TaxID=2507582 RepID=UPI00103C3407|nr:hypothetical protein [Rhodococcus sp. ABRD24]QBJ97147.1 hypothetical protein ERC79_15230 [Rhodococcus sp. ABRD24]